MNDPIRAALDTLLAAAREQPAVAAEFDASRAVFFAAGEPPTDDLASALRHLEWFCFERTSETVGDVPAFAWRASEERDVADAVALLADNRVGMFEVGEVTPGVGLWLKDLLGQGELPVREPAATAELATGDLVVGRVYADGDGAFLLSPAAAVFREDGLVDALRDDAERARQGRRGTLRIAQSELEAMFFGARAGAGAASDAVATEELPEPDAVARTVRDRLVEADWDDEEVARLASTLVAAAVGQVEAEVANAAIADALDRYAFEGEGDIEALRLDLATWWASLRATAARERQELARGAGASTAARALSPTEADAPAADAREALAAFDRGREEGKDLDGLFRRLEQDLGLDDADDEDPGSAPDFPGVVGAMVEEFLWESERDGGAAVDAELLRAFGRRHREVGVFEQLEARALVDFAARAAIEEELCMPEVERRAAALVETLAAFARWADREHDLALWVEFEPAHARLVEDLPRAAAISRRLARPVGLDWSPAAWARVDEDRRTARVGDDAYEVASVPEGAALEPGDVLVGRADGRRFHAAAVLPRAADLLR